jgi:hypothetical protein
VLVSAAEEALFPFRALLLQSWLGAWLRDRDGPWLGRLLLEAGAAQHWPALRGFERNRRFRAALRTVGPGLRTHPGAPANALRLALLAVPWLVLELLVVEKKLLAGGEDKLDAAVAARQNSVGKFHGRHPLKKGKSMKSAMNIISLPVPFPCFVLW